MAIGLLAAVLTGCGSTGSGTTLAPETPAAISSSAPPDNSALEQQVRAYSTAFLAGNGDVAYDLLSQRCKERNTRPNFVMLVQQAGKLYGPQEIRSLKVDQAAGDLARVTYTYDKAELDQRGEPWVRESGVWRIDDC
ncbi:nuclear transport factor 2 family protein [Lentzea jiangxiensis]|uniref:DUF4878 domain-containing protein n=1 Tax=Lentzea jiangxiensis TaxID=641025 RepID=A0A1H0GU52_9PSEU|nr:nuclear transport factor 2 family protein [Lentzea jiangxiensis]SDO10379.1 hypothetical protein SAMN05421507_1011357 [Lentzea jiangxiensis]